MSKKTFIEVIVAALIFAAEAIMVLVHFFEKTSFMYEDTYFMYILAIFTNIEVIYGVILIIINTKKDD